MSEPTSTLITSHTWRPPQNAHLPLRRLDRPCGYMNCRRPRTEHADRAEVENCWRCGQSAAVGVCCSSHDKQLCHGCYRRTHFVEVCFVGCPKCAAENLPVVLR